MFPANLTESHTRTSQETTYPFKPKGKALMQVIYGPEYCPAGLGLRFAGLGFREITPNNGKSNGEEQGT